MRPEQVAPLPTPYTMSGRVIIFTSCPSCDWQARMTGDTEEEVDRDLHKVLNAHILDVHGRAA
jgi:Fe-S oxidoreductase